MVTPVFCKVKAYLWGDEEFVGSYLQHIIFNADDKNAIMTELMNRLRLTFGQHYDCDNSVFVFVGKPPLDHIGIRNNEDFGAIVQALNFKECNSLPLMELEVYVEPKTSDTNLTSRINALEKLVQTTQSRLDKLTQTMTDLQSALENDETSSVYSQPQSSPTSDPEHESDEFNTTSKLKRVASSDVDIPSKRSCGSPSNSMSSSVGDIAVEYDSLANDGHN